MPREGETPLARFAQAVADEDGFSFGSVALSDDGITFVLPVRRTRPRSCGYVVGTTVADRISATDPGRIDRLRVQNESPHRLFLPPGLLFDAAETASRGTTAGVLIDPGSSVELEVKCVHSSHAIKSGTALRLVPWPAPDPVRRALIARDQGLVWATVRDTIASRGQASDASDDLVSALAESGPNDRGHGGPLSVDLSDDLSCGLILLGADGVEFVEVFGSPEAWRSVSQPRALGLQRGTDQASFPNSPHIPRERLIQAAKEFLLRLAATEYRRTAVDSWTATDSSSEYTLLGREVIHLLAFGGGDPWTLRARSVGQAAAVGSISGMGLSPLLDPVEGDVAVAALAAADVDEDSEMGEAPDRPRRRKVLTSGWDALTFQSLESYSRKEFGGDRSAAMRSLVRQGLRRRGYFGPRPPARPLATARAEPSEEPSPLLEPGRRTLEARIRDYERIALSETFAGWLRLRARTELERLGATLEDESLRELARSALERMPAAPPEADIEETPAPDVVAAVPPPPLDVRPLLRRAFSASAAGQFSDALHLFDEVLEAEPNNRTALLGRAVALRRSGKSQESLAALDRVLEIEPTNAAALLNRGRVLQERGELEAALKTFDRLAATAPNDWDVWMARGDVLVKIGRHPEALTAYSEALRRNPDDEGLRAKIRAIERARAPPTTPASRAALPRDVQEGQSYLVKGGPPDLGYRLCRALAIRSVPLLVITPRDADRVRGGQALGDARIFELTTEPGGDRIPPTALALLTNTIERFLTEHHGRAAILLEGLSTLVQSNDFRETALFLGRVNEDVLQSQAIFLVSVARGELAEKEIAILERDLRPLS